MTPSRRAGCGCPSRFRFFLPVRVILFLFGLIFSAQAELPPYKIELRLSEKPELQLLDNEGKIHHSLPAGTVRKRVSIRETMLLASFGKDNQHRPVIMLSLDVSANQPVVFLFGKNVIVTSPEAILTLQISSDHSIAQINPSLMGQIWVNGDLLSRGETKKLQVRSAHSSTPAAELTPSPDQPKPSVKDFQSIPTPSL